MKDKEVLSEYEISDLLRLKDLLITFYLNNDDWYYTKDWLIRDQILAENIINNRIKLWLNHDDIFNLEKIIELDVVNWVLIKRKMNLFINQRAKVILEEI